MKIKAFNEDWHDSDKLIDRNRKTGIFDDNDAVACTIDEFLTWCASTLPGNPIWDSRTFIGTLIVTDKFLNDTRGGNHWDIESLREHRNDRVVINTSYDDSEDDAPYTLWFESHNHVYTFDSKRPAMETPKANESKETSQVEYSLKTKLDFYKKRHPGSGLTYAILKQLYNRGYKSWKTYHPKNVNAHQWGLTRVNSFLTKGFSWKDVDKDLAEKVSGNAAKQKHKKYFGKYEKK